jgi:hypothetical protein
MDRLIDLGEKRGQAEDGIGFRGPLSVSEYSEECAHQRRRRDFLTRSGDVLPAATVRVAQSVDEQGVQVADLVVGKPGAKGEQSLPALHGDALRSREPT